MNILRRLSGTIGAISVVVIALMVAFGPGPVVHGLVMVTAIDHWHPYWPGQAAVAEAAPSIAGVVAVLAFLIYFGLGFVEYLFSRGHMGNHSAGASTLAGGAIGSAEGPFGSAILGQAPYKPSREQFHAELCELIQTTGLVPQKCVEVADMAMLTADSDDPADWAGRVRREALTISGATGMYGRILSRDPDVAKTAQFLRDYGFRAAALARVGGIHADNSGLNFDGIIFWYRTDAFEAEDALVELLISAHQAHMAAVYDDGTPTQSRTVERHAQTLRHVCTKIALRGFVPPELDAEVGRDGTATAEELERWAVAQVVAVCSPMMRRPLPTVERETEEDQ